MDLFFFSENESVHVNRQVYLLEKILILFYFFSQYMVSEFSKKRENVIHYNCRDMKYLKIKELLNGNRSCHCYLFVLNYYLIFQNKIATFLQQREISFKLSTTNDELF